MKNFIILLLLTICIVGRAQTNGIISIDVGTQVTADTDNYSVGVALGITNFNNDYASLGFITKTYDNKTLCAGRLTGLIMLNHWLGTYMQGDLFVIHDKPPIYKTITGVLTDVQYNRSRLELSTGLAIKGGHLLLMLGIQADDYDPIKDNRKQPVLTSRAVYNIQLGKNKDRRSSPYSNRRITPKGF